jgi:hypothetical protein
MIVEGVLNGGLVPGDEIRACHWDGIPLVINHPRADDGTPMSANAPEVPSVGRVYRTQYLTLQQQTHALTRAQAELWLDVAQVQALGGEAVQALQMLETQNPLEVSTAFYSYAEPTRGSFYGVPYTEIHHELLADHLALLPNSIGACSWGDGCGCPRLNQEETPMEKTGVRAWFGKLRQFMHAADAHLVTHTTDTDVREALYGAIAREMGMDLTPVFIESLDMANQTFTYRQGERLLQRSWTVEDGQIVLTDGAQDVQRTTTYTPVTQAQEDPPMATEAVHTRVTALITNTHTPWTERDRVVLETMSEAQLAHLEPDQAALAALHAQETRKTELVTALVGNPWCGLSESTLKHLSVEDLEKLTAMGPQEASYAGQGLPAGRQQDGSPPPPLNTLEEVVKLQREMGLRV